MPMSYHSYWCKDCIDKRMIITHDLKKCELCENGLRSNSERHCAECAVKLNKCALCDKPIDEERGVLER
jgi:hypothetical protein